MAAKKETRVHEEKAKAVKTLAERVNKSRTLMIISIKGLPSRQFQEIKKTLRKDASIQVAKKNILVRTLKALGKESALQLEPLVNENCAFLSSDIEGFELAKSLIENKNPVFAKAGQVSPIDIEIKEGPTDLVPGPAISELGAVGLQVSVENGKLSIRKSKVVVKQGEIIKEGVASILQKLSIQPFSVGLEPIAIYDLKTEKVYTNIKIEPEKVLEDLKIAASKALGFAQKLAYTTKETIGYLLAKANMHYKAIEAKTQLNTPGGNI
jgi:large subunit ribosomal protein L10